MINEDLRQLVLAELHGGLWHTTHPDRFHAILSSGAILPEPPIPNPDGWRPLSGEDYMPYVRKLGGVSLFDFDQFDQEGYDERFRPGSSWHVFVPYRAKWGEAVWIEIDREKIASQFISGPDLLLKRRADGAYTHGFMPIIEAAHIGALPRTAFKRAFRIGKGDTCFQELSV